MINSNNQLVDKINGIRITIKREDLIDDYFSGNKLRKLKYNLQKAKDLGLDKIITFGGPFSNHLYATALLTNKLNIPSVGFIRGEELKNNEKNNHTLSICKMNGMDLKFISRSSYKHKESSFEVKSYLKNNNNVLIIPEGGSNELGIKGCKEILNEIDLSFDAICCPIGTGGTITGIIECSKKNQTIIGFPSLMNQSLKKNIRNMTKKSNWIIQNDYIFGGYAKVSEELIDFINNFYKKYKILLDPIYTGKMLFGIFDLIKKNKWNWGKNILIIHTGGQQGIIGMNQKLFSKGKLIINFPENY